MSDHQPVSKPLLSVQDVSKHFTVAGERLFEKRHVHAVNGVSFDITRGETLSLVGESGCGKSTVGRCILRLTDLSAGKVELDGTRIDDLPDSALRPVRRRIGTIFQDPFSSINPRMKVRDVIAEPLVNFGIVKGRRAIDERVAELLELVRLPGDAGSRWPHEFSGGQRQRISIARALAGEPEVIICDEAVSALDVSVKAQIVNLLQDLQRRLGVAFLFISHDLAIVEHMTHRVAVMYLGKIVEIGSRTDIFTQPRHPYTEALMSAVPVPEPDAARKRIILKGDVPSPLKLPTGCAFHTRCPHAFDRCRVEAPDLERISEGHLSSCHLNQRERVPAQSA